MTTNNTKPKRVRDFKAEYAARIVRAEQLAKKAGVEITRSQARGHARKEKSEPSIRELQKADKITKTSTPVLNKYDAVIKRINNGESLTAATKAEKMSPKTFKNLATKNEDLKATKSGQKLELIRRYFDLPTSDGVLHEGVSLNKENASHAGYYWDAVLKSNGADKSPLDNLLHTTITDVYGNNYNLLTDYNKLVGLGVTDLSSTNGSALTSKIYRIE